MFHTGLLTLLSPPQSRSDWCFLRYMIYSKIQTRNNIIQSSYEQCPYSWWVPSKAVDHPKLSLLNTLPHIDNHQKFPHISPQFIKETVNVHLVLVWSFIWDTNTNTDRMHVPYLRKCKFVFGRSIYRRGQPCASRRKTEFNIYRQMQIQIQIVLKYKYR